MVHLLIFVAVCSLPFVGLAMYFLSTGLDREISVADRERVGLMHVAQSVNVLEHAVRMAWAGTDNDAQLTRKVDEALAALSQVEGDLGGGMRLSPATFAAGSSSHLDAPHHQENARKITEIWQQVKATTPGTVHRSAALHQLVSQIHDGIFQTSDRSGLGAGPENEISALTDVVAVCLPPYVERLLHMHERMVPKLHDGHWDVPTREDAAIFARELREEDLRRLSRSVEAALYADAHSAHVLESFQRDYPPQAERLLDSVRRLTGAVDPMAAGAGPEESVQAFDAILLEAFNAAIVGWNASIRQLDDLVADQISEARDHRNEALLLSFVLSAILLPLAWVYYHFFVRALISQMVTLTAENELAAEAARAAADESILRLKQTQAALDDHSAVTVVDVGGRILAINDRMCQLSGFSRERLLLGPFASLVAEGFEGVVLAEMWATAKRGEVWHGTIQHRNKDGQPFWVDATVFPFRNREGQAHEFVVIETNITELVGARETAESAARAKSQFLAMMSHEIRTPMNGVIGFARILAETKLDDQQRDHLQTILTSSESLLVIINDILDFSKLEAGRTELAMEPLGLRALIEDVVDLLAAQARHKNIALTYTIDPAVPEGILGDRARLRQVLLNLAGNAVKFTMAGRVSLTITRADGGNGTGTGIVFHVRDSGIGIPPERVSRLFSAFTQADASISRTYGGTGLGLAISQRLIGLMGGKIEVDSTPGKGSDFHFTLPIVIASVLPLPRPTTPAVPPSIPPAAALPVKPAGQKLAHEHPLKIAVVDDFQTNLKLILLVLRGLGYEPESFDNATALLERLKQQRFDLVFMDVQMPEVDGLEATRRIRSGLAGEANRQVSIVAISAGAMADERAACIAIGMQGFIAKPVARAEVITAIKAAHASLGSTQ